MNISQLSGIAAGAGQTAKPSKADLKQAAQAFEAIFLRQMISSMRSASLGDGIFDNSASEQFRDMADSRVADHMSKLGSFGIADLLMKQFGATDATGRTSETNSAADVSADAPKAGDPA